MGGETQAQEIKLRDYLWGIMVANAPVYIVNYFREIVAVQHPIVQMLVFGLASFGGCFLASYSIKRKTGQSYQKAGLTTGLLSYAAYTILILVTGFVRPSIFLEDAVLIMGFVVGGALGVKFWEKRHPRTK